MKGWIKQMKYALLFVLWCLAVMSPAMAHDYHVSITDVSYNARTQRLEVAMKVFTDDLEEALSRRTKTKVHYSSSSEQVKRYLEAYVQANLAFALQKGKPLKTVFLGSEEEADVVWLYVEIPLPGASLSQLYVRNGVLTELFTDQMNIVSLTYKGKTTSVLLQTGDTEKKLSL